MKQTAVEWLEMIVKAMIENGGDLGEDLPALMNHIEQAKAMEKEQMNEIHIDGIEQGYNMRYQQEKKMKDDTNNP
jgi:hypothetical protein